MSFQTISKGLGVLALALATSAYAQTYTMRVPISVASSGESATPPEATENAVALSASTLAFGSLNVGQAATRSLAVINPGPHPARIVSIATDNPEFASTHDCPATLAPGSDCAVNVTFQPLSEQAYAAHLTVTDSLGTRVASMTAVAGAPAMHIGGNGNVGVVHVGDTAQASFSVSNTGSGTLALASIDVVGSDAFSVTPASTCSSSTVLAAGQACDVVVDATPVAGGETSATLQVNAEGSIQASASLVMDAYQPFALEGVTPGEIEFAAEDSTFTVNGQYLTDGLAVAVGSHSGVLAAAGNGASGTFTLAPDTGTWDVTVTNAEREFSQTLEKAIIARGEFTDGGAGRCVDSAGGQVVHFQGKNMPNDAVFLWAGAPVTPAMKNSSFIVFETAPMVAGDITWTLQRGVSPTPNDVSGTITLEQATTQGTITTVDATANIFGGNPTQLYYRSALNGGNGRVYAGGTGSLPRAYAYSSSPNATSRGTLVAVSHQTDTVYAYGNPVPETGSTTLWKGSRANWAGTVSIMGLFTTASSYMQNTVWIGVANEGTADPRFVFASSHPSSTHTLRIGHLRINSNGSLQGDGHHQYNVPVFIEIALGNATAANVVVNVMETGVVAAWTDPVTGNTKVALIPDLASGAVQVQELDGCETQWQPVTAVAASPSTIYLATKTAMFANPKGSNEIDRIAGHLTQASPADGAGRAARMTNVTAMFYHGGLIYFADNGRYRNMNRNVPAP